MDNHQIPHHLAVLDHTQANRHIIPVNLVLMELFTPEALVPTVNQARTEVLDHTQANRHIIPVNLVLMELTTQEALASTDNPVNLVRTMVQLIPENNNS